MTNTLPKRIWILWLQGYDEAPPIVKHCYHTWKDANPDWEVVLLNQDNLQNYVKIDLPDSKIQGLTPNGYANLIRLKLLIEYGGVWADSTCYCLQPLNDWMPHHIQSGFFAFNNLNKDRLISNWFLAARPNNYIIKTLYDNLIHYWQNNNLQYIKNIKALRLLNKTLRSNVYISRYWFHPLITKILKVYPYFNFHYMFAKLVSDDVMFSKIWNETPKHPAVSLMQECNMYNMLKPETQVFNQLLSDKVCPMFKLSWKYNIDDMNAESKLHKLMSS
jgi:hypothetical protein